MKHLTDDQIDEKIKKYDVTFCPHSLSTKMNIVSKIANLIGYKNFKDVYWVTIGKTIYHPDNVNPFCDYGTIEHELVHVDQQHKMGLVKWLFKYLTSARFRYEQEREAYMVNVMRGISVLCIVSILRSYLTNVSENEMISWFYLEQKKRDIEANS